MSADNYYLIRRTDTNLFQPLMGFASDDRRPFVVDHNLGHRTPEEAIGSVIDDYAEYGHRIDPECYLSDEEWEATTLPRRDITALALHYLREGRENNRPDGRVVGAIATIAAERVLTAEQRRAEEEREAVTHSRHYLCEEILYCLLTGRQNRDPDERTAGRIAALAEEWVLDAAARTAEEQEMAAHLAAFEAPSQR